MIHNTSTHLRFKLRLRKTVDLNLMVLKLNQDLKMRLITLITWHITTLSTTLKSLVVNFTCALQLLQRKSRNHLCFELLNLCWCARVCFANHRNDVHLSKYVLVDCNYVKVLHLCDVLIHEATLITQEG